MIKGLASVIIIGLLAAMTTKVIFLLIMLVILLSLIGIGLLASHHVGADH
jgi:hypothetical protein